MAIPEISHRAHRIAIALQKRFPVNTRLIPEGKSFDFSVYRPILEPGQIKLFIKTAGPGREVNQQPYNIMENQVHYLAVCSYLLNKLSFEAQKNAQLKPEEFRMFAAAIRKLVLSRAIPYDVLDVPSYLNNSVSSVFNDMDAACANIGRQRFADFVGSFESAVLELRHNYANGDLEKLVSREQPEHVLFHSVYFAVTLSAELKKRYCEK
ncbi:TPA: hypothetical protein HA243_04175 [Candidatus Micrarchaeota archaeon]|nr:hypothetical protein [Candidatus Micrarchaeota archaeon]